MMAGRANGGNTGGDAGTRPLVIRNTNVAVTTLGSGQALPTAAQTATALQGLCNSSRVGRTDVQVTPVSLFCLVRLCRSLVGFLIPQQVERKMPRILCYEISGSLTLFH